MGNATEQSHKKWYKQIISWKGVPPFSLHYDKFVLKLTYVTWLHGSYNIRHDKVNRQKPQATICDAIFLTWTFDIIRLLGKGLTNEVLVYKMLTKKQRIIL